MASVVDKFVFALMLDAKGFKSGANTAIGALGSIKNAFLKTYSLVGGFDLFKNMARTYTDVAKSVDDFSLITGENIYKLQAWQKAVQDTGGDISGLQGTVRRFTDMQAQLQRYGTAEGLEQFLRIGIDPRGKSAFQLLQLIGKTLASVKDNARAFNIAKNIGIDESTFIMFRRYGENFEKVINANAKYAYINKQAIQDTREYNRILSSFKTSWLQLSQSIMKDVLPVLEKNLFPVIKNITDYLINEALPCFKNDILPILSKVADFSKFAAEFYGTKVGEIVGNAEQGKSLTQAQFDAGKKAKEAGLSIGDILEMNKLAKDITDVQHYRGFTNAYIDIKVNANNADGKQLGQDIAAQLRPAAMKLSEQLGSIRQ